MVQVKTAFDDFDSKFSDSEASEAVYLSFASSDVTLDDVLVTQEDVLGILNMAQHFSRYNRHRHPVIMISV